MAALCQSTCLPRGRVKSRCPSERAKDLRVRTNAELGRLLIVVRVEVPVSSRLLVNG